MSSSPLKVGIVGCGIIANTHIPYIRKAGGVLVAVADTSSARANDLADRLGVSRVYLSLEDLLEVEKPDVVHVLTPPHTHAAVARTAIDRGVHTLIEKPMTLDPDEAAELARAAEERQVLLTVDHNRLFDPVMLKARHLADSGALGEVVSVESYQAGSASQRDWISSLGGGGLGDLIPHPLYLQLAFMGGVKRIDARAFRLDGDTAAESDELRVLMEGERCSGVLIISQNARPALNTLRICGTRMTIEVNLNNMTIVKRREYNVPKVIGKSLPNLDESRQLLQQTFSNTVNFLRGKVRYYPGMGNLIKRFYDAISQGTAPPVTAEEGVEVVRVTKDIWDAAVAVAEPGSSREAV